MASRARAGRRPSPAWLAFALGALVAALTIAGLVAVAAAGQSAGQLIRLTTVLSVAAVGTLVASRRPGNPLGWLMLGAGLFVSVSIGATGYVVLDYRLHHGTLPLGRLAVALEPSWVGGLVLLTGCLWLFPDGTLPTARRRRVALALFGAGLAYAMLVYVPWVAAAVARQVRVDATGTPVASHGVGTGPVWAGYSAALLVLPLSWAVWLAVQVPKYRRSTGERRLQLKWLYSGAVVFTVSLAVSIFEPPSTALTWQVIGGVVGTGLAALPAVLGIGILKFRLYDIDRVISRTLSYALVTGLIVGVYAGLVLLATWALPRISGVAVAGATLVVAALFNPLRRRVQRTVDRRFNRARYDAEATVATFAGRLRESVDLTSVQNELAAAVDQAFEPTHVSVWLADRAP